MAASEAEEAQNRRVIVEAEESFERVHVALGEE